MWATAGDSESKDLRDKTAYLGPLTRVDDQASARLSTVFVRTAKNQRADGIDEQRRNEGDDRKATRALCSSTLM